MMTAQQTESLQSRLKTMRKMGWDRGRMPAEIQEYAFAMDVAASTSVAASHSGNEAGPERRRELLLFVMDESRLPAELKNVQSVRESDMALSRSAGGGHVPESRRRELLELAGVRGVAASADSWMNDPPAAGAAPPLGLDFKLVAPAKVFDDPAGRGQAGYAKIGHADDDAFSFVAYGTGSRCGECKVAVSANGKQPTITTYASPSDCRLAARKAVTSLVKRGDQVWERGSSR